MKFEFTTTTTVDTTAWTKSNQKLELDLQELMHGTVSENEVISYLNDMVSTLKPVENDNCHNMLFLMYDKPSSMPADARVAFVYKPTYLAATIMMTAMNRFDRIAQNDAFQKAASMLMEASLGREFHGAGCDKYIGYMETLQIFATGDTLAFIEKYPNVNERFVSELKKAIQFLKDDICSGKIRDMWSGEDYSEQGKKILAMYQNAKNNTRYVWYACYGSNICKERFMRYINRCTDTTPPIEDRPYHFPYNVYFAKTSSLWQNGGKAFLDDSCNGNAYGRIYKVTYEQYVQIKSYEGSDYAKQIYLGNIEGLPVYSFTDTQKNVPTRTPSKEYFNTIYKGLCECSYFALSTEDILDYLTEIIFPAYTWIVVRTIKESAHGVSNAQIVALTGLDEETVTYAVSWLVEHNVIQQDRRSVRAGHQIGNPEATFFTVDNPCARELVTHMMDLYSEINTK